MSKRMMILGLIAVCCSAAYAAVNITLTVPDAYVTPALEAFTALAGTHMTLEARGNNPDPAQEFDGRWDFTIAKQGPSESNQDFAKRFTLEMVRACFRVVKQDEEQKRYRDEVSAVSPPDVNVPDSVVQ